MLKKTKKFYLMLLLLSTVIANFSCRKMDGYNTQDVNDKAITSKFLYLPSTVIPEVRRVANKLATLDDKTGFLNTIAKVDGFAVWDKALLTTVNKELKSTVARTSGVSDTIVYIPLVLENGKQVNAFIFARLRDTIRLKLFRADEYANYGFGSLSDSTNNAEKLAIQFMLLDYETFGHSNFKVLDERLFRSSLPQSGSIRKDTRISIKRSESSSHARVNSLELWQYDVCVTPKVLNCSLNTTCCTNAGVAPGECNSCVPCWQNGIRTCTKTSIIVYVDDDLNPEGAGGPGNGGGGGGGGGTMPGTSPCNPTPEIDNGLPPCTRGNGDGWEPSQVTEYYDYAIPPFTWTYFGDDGTTYSDAYPLEEPDFQFDPIDDYETNYPRFTNMVKNLKTFVKSNPKVLNALQVYSGFNKQQILNHLTFGQGPTIKVEEMTGRFGFYNKNNGRNTLHIRASYVRGLEQAFLKSTQEATAFLLAVTILHEYVHLGTSHNNISEGIYDFGYGFERDAFNVIVDDDNAGKVVIKFSQYF